MAQDPVMNKYEEEFLRGDQQPCWCCAQNLRTAALIVAICILYSHCIVAFMLLTFFVIDFDDKTTLDESKNYRLVLIIGAVVSIAYIPLGLGLLIGIVKNRLWMCSLWFWVILTGTLLDFGAWAVDQTVQFVVFTAVFLLVRCYFLYVIGAYIVVVKRQRRLQQAWENLSKEEITTIAGENDIESEGGGDSRVELGQVDIDDDLSHDSVMEKIKATDSVMTRATMPRSPSIKFKSIR